MKRMKFIKRIGSIILAAMVSLPVGPFQAITQVPVLAATLENGLATESEDGVILQAYNWSFNTIKEKLPELAADGYTTIQTSPVQGTKENAFDAGHWWLLYQPTNQSIGNVQLGSKDDFAALCAEADKYGIKIIVDAVLNHMANNGNKEDWRGVVDREFDRSDFYHNWGICGNYKDRWQMTQQCIGQPDLNTHNPEVQNKAINFLNECIDAGADGFRFDAAKHIETNKGEDAGQAWASNYWDRVLGGLHNKDNAFLYGEILQDTGCNIWAYTNYMRVTDHNYGGTLREAVKNKYLYNIGYYNTGIDANKLVSYFENHDSYQDGSSSWLSDYERKMCWGILAARAGVTPMLLARPASTMGNAGDNLWQNPEVVAVNFFHNAMAGQNEYIRYIRNETVLIDRGTIGTAIINTSDGFYLDSETNLKDGNYQDKAGSGATFNVSGGRIRGQVPGGRIVVLYNTPNPGPGPIDPINTDTVKVSPQVPVSGQEVTITYNASNTVLKGSKDVSLHWGYDGWLKNYDVPMNKVDANTWEVTVTVPANAESKLDFVFTNGAAWDNNNRSDWHYTVDPNGGVITESKAYFVKPANWSNNINIYVYDESGSTVKEVKSWPGVAMTNEGNGLYSYTLPAGWDKAHVIFNDGNSQIPGANQPGYELTGEMIYDNGNWSSYVEAAPMLALMAETAEEQVAVAETTEEAQVEEATIESQAAEEVAATQE